MHVQRYNSGALAIVLSSIFIFSLRLSDIRLPSIVLHQGVHLSTLPILLPPILRPNPEDSTCAAAGTLRYPLSSPPTTTPALHLGSTFQARQAYQVSHDVGARSIGVLVGKLPQSSRLSPRADTPCFAPWLPSGTLVTGYVGIQLCLSVCQDFLLGR